MPKLNKAKTAGVPVRLVAKPHRKCRTKEAVIKRDQLIRMLGAKKVAGADAICQKLGWKPHKTWAAISGLRKAGFEIATQTEVSGKGPRYRIVGGAASGGDQIAA